MSGRCADLVGHIIPSDDSPAGVAIAFGAPQLFAFPKRQFDCLARIVPEIPEELVVPVPGAPEPWGALWVMSHDGDQHFDSEHRRILTSLADITRAGLTMAKARADVETRAIEAETARNALSEAERAKDNFIATLGHELRGPLAPVESALAAAQKLAAGSPAVLSALAVANRQVQQLKRIVSDLLNASRVRHGKLSVRPAYALLGDIVKDALAAVSDEVDQTKCQDESTSDGNSKAGKFNSPFDDKTTKSLSSSATAPTPGAVSSLEMEFDTAGLLLFARGCDNYRSVPDVSRIAHKSQ